MFNLKEIIVILLVGIIISFSISISKSISVFLYTTIIVLSVILINIIAKKTASYYFDSKIETKIWEISQYGFNPSQSFKKPVPVGIILPLISKILFFSVGGFVWMASLVFDVKPRVYRSAKRHGLYTFSEMTEDHIGFIAASGIIANLLFAIIGYLIGIPEFSRISIYYAFFNILPIYDLDGNKIFFGHNILWSFLAALVFIALFFAIFIT